MGYDGRMANELKMGTINALLLLHERGRSFRELAARSGFPIGTLASLSQKLRREKDPNPGFCELTTVEAPSAAGPSSVTVRFRAGHGLVLDGELDPESLERLARAYAALAAGCLLLAHSDSAQLILPAGKPRCAGQERQGQRQLCGRAGHA